MHEKIINFKNRTEFDYTNAERARFNILHYKSSVKQEKQDEIYFKIKGQGE